MEHDALELFHTQLQALYEKGDESAAQKLIAEEFPKLPESVQGDILTRMYFKGLEVQNRQAAVVAEIQEKGLEILDTLDVMEQMLKDKKK